MYTVEQLANHFRQVYFGGNWTASNLRDLLSDVSWQQAVRPVHSFNTIAALTYHVHYFVAAIRNVLEGNPLDAHDKYSFDVPPITSEQDWQNLLEKVWADAERLAELMEQVPDPTLQEPFTNEKYGSYYRNFLGLIEHTHYHLGQIALLKKLVQEPASN